MGFPSSAGTISRRNLFTCGKKIVRCFTHFTKRKLITHFKEAFSVKKNRFSFRNEFIPFIGNFCSKFFISDGNRIECFGNADADRLAIGIADCESGRTFAEPGRAVTFAVSIAVTGNLN